MAKTNLKYFDYISLRVYTVYTTKAGHPYIRRNGERIWINSYGTFDLRKMPKLNRTNLVRYLRKQIKFYSEKTDSCKRKNDDWNMNRAIGSRDAFESTLEYVLKMREE